VPKVAETGFSSLPGRNRPPDYLKDLNRDARAGISLFPHKTSSIADTHGNHHIMHAQGVEFGRDGPRRKRPDHRNRSLPVFPELWGGMRKKKTCRSNWYRRDHYNGDESKKKCQSRFHHQGRRHPFFRIHLVWWLGEIRLS